MPPTTIFSKSASGTTAVRGDRFVQVPKGGLVSLQLATLQGSTLAGSWVIYGSNKPGADVDGDADASDITAAFSIPGLTPAAVAVVVSGASSQAVQAGPLYFAYLDAKFIPTSGAGTAAAHLNAA